MSNRWYLKIKKGYILNSNIHEEKSYKVISYSLNQSENTHFKNEKNAGGIVNAYIFMLI